MHAGSRHLDGPKQWRPHLLGGLLRPAREARVAQALALPVPLLRPVRQDHLALQLRHGHQPRPVLLVAHQVAVIAVVELILRKFKGEHASD